MVRQRSIAIFRTPLGWAGVAVNGAGIRRVVLPRKTKKAVEAEFGDLHAEPVGPGTTALLIKASKFLQRYFSGRPAPVDLLLDLRYYTAFQQAVWKAAAAIPYGETRSYAWIAQRIRNPRAVRAVGQALGANPVPIIIPCHRVISASGALGGFSGGQGMKERLLELEHHDKKRH